jgi:hypothetical protein
MTFKKVLFATWNEDNDEPFIETHDSIESAAAAEVGRSVHVAKYVLEHVVTVTTTCQITKGKA